MSRSERRRSSRCLVDFFVQETRGERTYLHPALDLSATGVYLAIGDERRAFDGSEPLALEFTLPTGVLVTTVGRVAYVDERQGQRGVGVTFTDIDALQRLAIARFVEVSQAVQRRLHAMA